MDDEKMQAYKDASAGRRASVFDPKALSKMKQSVSSSVKSAAESASTGVKNATDTGIFGFSHYHFQFLISYISFKSVIISIL